MTARNWLVFSVTTTVLTLTLWSCPAPACCPAPHFGKAVVNADQTVIIIWDAESKTQHFIRQASFKSEADDFGFLIPSPTQPELHESGNEAFPFLLKLTEPEIQTASRPSSGIGCSSSMSAGKVAAPGGVKVLDEKLVAGFDAVVLEAESADDLVRWLKDHGYAYSPEIQAWAKPYVGAGWKITALKVAKDKDGQPNKTVSASALRMTFKTDRPLFPYREPDPKNSAASLDAKHRLLRVYFLADARYQGEFGNEKTAWAGKVAWSNQLAAEDRKKLLEMLKLQEAAGPAKWWLTEFEHDWPYAVAPADLYFTRAADQGTVKRPPIIQYVAAPLPSDGMVYALGAVVVLPPLLRRCRRLALRPRTRSAP
jgi:hypothetical protein